MRYAIFLFLFILFSPAEADLLNFDFSFTGDSNHGGLGGMITGEIVGLENNASSTPSDIILTSFPPGLDIPSSAPYSLNDNGWNLAGDADGQFIVVSNSLITSATDYEATISGQQDFFSLNVPFILNDVEQGPLNGLQYGPDAEVSNFDGFSGVTYTLVTIPEPAKVALLLISLVMLGSWCPFRRKSESL
jgi:hypothetical protein